jgi:hypothetical protein
MKTPPELRLVEHARSPVTSWLAVYGRVPLFYYVVHIHLAHALAVALAFAQERGDWWLAYL